MRLVRECRSAGDRTHLTSDAERAAYRSCPVLPRHVAVVGPDLSIATTRPIVGCGCLAVVVADPAGPAGGWNRAADLRHCAAGHRCCAVGHRIDPARPVRPGVAHPLPGWTGGGPPGPAAGESPRVTTPSAAGRPGPGAVAPGDSPEAWRVCWFVWPGRVLRVPGTGMAVVAVGLPHSGPMIVDGGGAFRIVAGPAVAHRMMGRPHLSVGRYEYRRSMKVSPGNRLRQATQARVVRCRGQLLIESAPKGWEECFALNVGTSMVTRKSRFGLERGGCAWAGNRRPDPDAHIWCRIQTPGGATTHQRATDLANCASPCPDRSSSGQQWRTRREARIRVPCHPDV